MAASPEARTFSSEVAELVRKTEAGENVKPHVVDDRAEPRASGLLDSAEARHGGRSGDEVVESKVKRRQAR